MAKVKTVFLLPVLDNDGRSLIPEIKRTVWEAYDRFGGWTFEGVVEGAFRMASGKMQSDECMKYTVVLEGKRIQELVDALRQFKSQTLQEAIYLEIDRKVEIRFV